MQIRDRLVPDVNRNFARYPAIILQFELEFREGLITAAGLLFSLALFGKKTID